MHRWRCRRNQSFVVVEDADEEFWEDGKQSPDCQRICETQLGHEADCPFHQAHIVSPVIIADDGGGSFCNCHHRRLGNLPDRADDRHDADVKVASENLEGGIADDLNQAVGERHAEGGDSQFRDFPDAGEVWGESMEIKGQFRLFPGQETKDPYGGEELGDNRRKRRPLHSHMEQEDENGVKDDV